MEDNNNFPTALADGYPPPRHMLRDLRIAVEFQGDRCTGRAPVVPQVCTDLGGVRAGVIATLVDIAGGALAIKNIYPDWMATASLSVHVSGRATCGTIVADAGIVREGRNFVVVEVDILEQTKDGAGRGRQIGLSVITLSRLPRRRDTVTVVPEAAGGITYGIPGAGFSAPYLDMVGLRVLDPASGAVEVGMHEYIRNSFHALQGGMIALLADLSGEQAARAATGKPLTTRDFTVHYLAQGKVGPFRTRAKIVRKTPDTVLSRVEIIDAGAGDRLLSVAMNTAALED